MCRCCDSSVVCLRDIARVELGAKAYTRDSRLDGGPAALFLGEVKALLEAPYRLLL